MRKDLKKKSLTDNDDPYWCDKNLDTEVLEVGADDLEEIKRRAIKNKQTIVEEIRQSYMGWQMAVPEFNFVKSFFKYLTPTEKMLNWQNKTEKELEAMELIENKDKQIEELFSDREVEELKKKYLK
jgi:hypothetical protein